MPRIVALLVTLFVTSAASAQTIIDGSSGSVPAAAMGPMMTAVKDDPYLGASSQLRGLHAVSKFNTVYICGQATSKGTWQAFYYETKIAAVGVGEKAMIMCSN